MKSKKSPKADLERKKGLFLEIGFILALGLCLVAFEWSSDDVSTTELGNLSSSEVEIEMIAITKEKEPPPKQNPPKIEPEKILKDLKVVDNKKHVKRIKWDSDLKEKNSPKIITITNNDIIEDPTEPIPFYAVKEKPIYPGGEIAMLKFIQTNSVYPSIPKENGVEGIVLVQFIIDATGKVTNVKTLNQVDSYLDAEALRVVSLLPDWSPGKQREIPVPVTFVLPIKFNLE